MISFPDPIPPGDWRETAIIDNDDVEKICERLWNLESSNESVKFSPIAKRRWVEWVNDHRAEDPPDNLRPMHSKAEGHCARLALVLYLARRTCGETLSIGIDEPSIDGAIQLIEYFKSHAPRAYGRAVEHSDTGRIGNALRWIRKRGGVVTARQVHMYGLTKTSEAAKELLADLEELGHGTVTQEPRGSVVFRLSPTQPNAQQDNRTE